MRRRFRLVRLNQQIFAVPEQDTVPPGVVDGVLVDPQAYFFWLIDREPNQNADDWYSVLSACGLPPGLPPNVYPSDNGFYGLTQQIRSSGEVAGRIFLPTASPDDLGYYAHPISPLKDAPEGGGHLLWEWRSLGGPPYVPVATSDNGTIPPSNGISAVEVQAMIDASLEPIDARLTALEQGGAGIQFGDKIALETNSGMIAGIKGGGPNTLDAPIEWIGKVEIHSWESFIIQKGE